MSLVQKFASVGSATMASRVLGFVREALIAAVLGAGPVTDAFYAALRFPNLFRRLFAEGAFNTAFIPLFAKELEGGGMDAARRFASDVVSVLVAVLLVLTSAAIIFMPALVATIIAPGFADSPDKFDLTVEMTRIMFPYLFCMSLVAMFSGILNSMRRYFLAAAAPVLLNVFLVAVLLLAMLWGEAGATLGNWLAWAVMASGIAQLVLLIYGARREGFSLRPKAPRLTPAVRRLLILMAPAMLTGGVTQINLLVGQMIASAQDGAISLLNFADRINQLPLGVIGIAIGVVLLPELARALKAGDHADAAHLQNRSLEFAVGLTLPAAVGLIVLAEPVVALLYERGAFDRQATEMTAAALAAFAVGLPAFVLVKVFSPAFFAREDMRTPMWFSVVAVVVNIVGSLLLFPRFGHVGIAVSTSISGWINILLLALVLWRRDFFRPSAETVRRLVMIVLATVGMAAAAWLMMWAWSGLALDGTILARVIVVPAIIIAAAAVYFGIAFGTGAFSPDMIRRNVRRSRRGS